MDVEKCLGRSQKEGILFVQPPRAVLEQLVAVSVHLDDCAERHGPLRVVPGSHRFAGRLALEHKQPVNPHAYSNCPRLPSNCELPVRRQRFDSSESGHSAPVGSAPRREAKRGGQQSCPEAEPAEGIADPVVERSSSGPIERQVP